MDDEPLDTCSSLSPGDLTIVGLSISNNLEILILALHELPQGSRFNLTDNSEYYLNDDGNNDSSGGVITFTVPRGGISAGSKMMFVDGNLSEGWSIERGELNVTENLTIYCVYPDGSLNVIFSMEYKNKGRKLPFEKKIYEYKGLISNGKEYFLSKTADTMKWIKSQRIMKTYSLLGFGINSEQLLEMASAYGNYEQKESKIGSISTTDMVHRLLNHQKPSISPAPTFIPTSSPTSFPTTSIRPTSDPTLPTLIPTIEPTALPSDPPTDSPTSFPTGIPTLNPSTFPTDEPSLLPSHRQSMLPTLLPTLNPTSSSPTSMPTTSSEPTKPPSSSQKPTSIPTTSSEPTKTPSSSHKPTHSTPYPTTSRPPSFVPTLAPSILLSLEPSISPSKMPTTSPTNIPTETPTSIPSMLPTAIPSSFPTITEMNKAMMSRLSLHHNTNNAHSFGTMFDIRAINEISIKSLSFYTDYKDTTYNIYTKSGSFRDASSDISKWTLISSGAIIGQGPDQLTHIPVKTFTFTSVSIGATQAIYITLSSPQLGYAITKSDIGSVYNSNSDLEQMVGIGITSQVLIDQTSSSNVACSWNGAIYYVPTRKEMVITKVVYTVQVTYGLDVSRKDVVGRVENSVEESINIILANVVAGNVDYNIPENARDMRLVMIKGMVDTSGELAKDCNTQDDASMCAYITITSTLSHASSFSSEDVKFMFLAFKDFVLDNLPFKQEYVGSEPLITGTTISLQGNELTEMESNDQSAFEEVVKGFLVKQNPNVDILKVTVTGQNITLSDDSNHTTPRHRNHQQESQRRNLAVTASSIDVLCTITGEYMPPPEVDFDKVVGDSFEQEDGNFIEELKKEVDNFQSVEEIKIEVKPKKLKPFSPMAHSELVAEARISPVRSSPAPPPSVEFWSTFSGTVTIWVGGTLTSVTFVVILFSLFKRRRDRVKQQPLPLDLAMMPGVGLTDEFMNDEDDEQRQKDKQNMSVREFFSEMLGGSKTALGTSQRSQGILEGQSQRELRDTSMQGRSSRTLQSSKRALGTSDRRVRSDRHLGRSSRTLQSSKKALWTSDRHVRSDRHILSERNLTPERPQKVSTRAQSETFIYGAINNQRYSGKLGCSSTQL